MIDLGRDILGDLAQATAREWLCTNGIGGFASGTLAGVQTRRYHGLLIAALKPPLGRTLLVSHADEALAVDGRRVELATHAWAAGGVAPQGYRHLERFRLEGTVPVFTYAVDDVRLEKRVWMEPGENTTYVQYRRPPGGRDALLEVALFANYRDYHGATCGGDWRMRVTRARGGLRVTAFEGARPVLFLMAGAEAAPSHVWYRRFDLAAERERGLPAEEDHLHVGTFRAALPAGAAVTLVLSAETTADLDGAAALARRAHYEADLLARFAAASPAASAAPDWVRQLALAADQFVVRRPLPDDPEALSVIAGYHWFGDWGRDTMIALPGLALATGRPEVAARILTTFARFVDRGMLPNRFPDGGEGTEYNSVDAALWYIEAARATHAATGDDALLRRLFPVLEDIVAWHLRGTRYGIAVDPSDGLLHAGEPGIQLTWMDARVGDRVVTPRHGKPVEINALWYNALRSMAAFARRLGRDAAPYDAAAARAGASFARFLRPQAGYLYDVLDGPDGDDATLRPNQIYAVSLPESPLPPEQQRAVVEVCARHLATSFGLRSLAPWAHAYAPRYAGAPHERDAVYHQGTVWGFLAGPFALAHLRVYGDPEQAAAWLAPLAHQVAAYGVGTLGEIFDGEPPHLPRGTIAQAWTVAETLRAWLAIAACRGVGAPTVSANVPANGAPAWHHP